MRLLEEDLSDESEYHVAQLRFDDGGMRGLAAALCWCGIVYFASTLKDEDLCGGSNGMADLVKDLLEIPACSKKPGADPARSMISRIQEAASFQLGVGPNPANSDQ